MGHAQQEDSVQKERKKRELATMRCRDRELDRLFGTMYEDNVAGKIDDARFARMSKMYTEEQSELAEKMAVISEQLDKLTDKAMDSDAFISTVRKYTRVKKLTEQMLFELIDRVEVHQSEKVDGVIQQKLDIFYNGVGIIEIPDELSIPETEIKVNTRKGVTVCYSQSQKQIA